LLSAGLLATFASLLASPADRAFAVRLDHLDHPAAGHLGPDWDLPSSPVGEFPEQYNVYSYDQFLEDCTLVKLGEVPIQWNISPAQRRHWIIEN
jgi:hypothetical protein